MELRQVVTGTLAWTGLVVVVAVPTAEALLSRLAETPNAAHVRPAQPAAATTAAIIAPKPSAAPPAAEPTVKQASVTRSTGVSTPIIGGNAGHAVKPATTAAAVEVAPVAPAEAATPAATAPEVVAKVSTEAYPAPVEITPEKTAPVKDSAAELPPIEETPVEPGPASEPGDGEALTSQAVGGGLTDGLVAPPPPPPVPMSAAERPKAPPLRVVTAEELKDWKSGSLADYLRQQNSADSGNSAPDNQN